MMQVLVCICLFSLVSGFPVSNSHSDSSDNMEINHGSSESSLQTSEQQDSTEEVPILQKAEDVPGGKKEDNFDSHLSLPIDNGDIEEVSEGDDEHDEDLIEDHSISTEDKGNGDTTSENVNLTNEHIYEDEHGESGSNEVLYDHNQAKEILEIGGHHDNKDIVKPTTADSENNEDTDSRYVLSEETHLEIDGSLSSDVGGHQAAKSYDNDDEYEDNVSIIAGDSQGNPKDTECGSNSKERDGNENSKVTQNQKTSINQYYSYESDGDEIQNDDSNPLLTTSTDSSINTDVAVSSSKEKIQDVVGKKIKGKQVPLKGLLKNKVKKISDRDGVDEGKSSSEDISSTDTKQVNSVERSKSKKPQLNISHESSHSLEDSEATKSVTKSNEDTHSTENFSNSKERVAQSKKDLKKNTNQLNQEGAQLDKDSTQSFEDITLSAEDTTETVEDTTQSLEDINASVEDSTQSTEDITASVVDSTQSLEDLSKSKENISELKSAESHLEEIKKVKEVQKQSVGKVSKSISAEDDKDSKQDDHKPMQNNSSSIEDSSTEPVSEEDSEDIDSKQSDSKLDDEDATLEQSLSHESEMKESVEIRSILLGNSSLHDSGSSSKSKELSGISQEDNDSKNSSLKDTENATLEDDVSQSQESAESKSEEEKQSESSESEDVSKASMSIEIDSRRLLFDVYQRKAIGNDNDCQDGY